MMIRIAGSLIGAVLTVAAAQMAAGCAQAERTKGRQESGSKVTGDPCPGGEPHVGTAVRRPDGVIVLLLRSVENGMIAEGRFEYAPDDENYDGVVRHIGPMVDGREMLICPFPQEGTTTGSTSRSGRTRR